MMGTGGGLTALGVGEGRLGGGVGEGVSEVGVGEHLGIGTGGLASRWWEFVGGHHDGGSGWKGFSALGFSGGVSAVGVGERTP